MHKLIQSIALTMAVFSPLNLITLVTPAAAHHTPSHVNNISAQINVRSKKKKVKSPRTTIKKKRTTDTMKMKKKPAASGTAAPPAEMPINNSSPQFKPSIKPQTTTPTSKIRPIDPRLGNPTKPGTTTKLPDPSPSIPSIPLPTPGSVPNPAGNAPSLPRPNLPNLPTGTTK
jgi:hypothetical protein